MGRIIELFIGCLTWPNLACFIKPFSLFFHHLTPPVGGVPTNFWKNGFQKNDLSRKTIVQLQHSLELEIMHLFKFKDIGK